MKVTFVLPLADMGGGCRVVATYAHRLIQRGHDVVVVHHPYTTLRGRVSSALGWIFSKERWNPSRTHLDLLNVPQIRLSDAQSVVDDTIPNADVVIATGYTTANEVLALSPEKGVKAYFLQGYEAVLQGADQESVNKTWTYPMRKIVVAPWLDEIARRDFGDSSAIIVTNGVDIQHFTAPPRDKRSRPTVGFIFSHPDCKGSDVAIKAFIELKQTIPHLRLVSFGNSWRRRLRNGLRLPRWAEYDVLPSQARIRNLYAQCDVWVCASRSEGFGLPLLEAMSCRTPVVSTPIGIAPELAKQGGLCLVPFDVPWELAHELRRIIELSEDDWSTLSEEAYRTAQKYDIEQSALQFEKALDKIVSGRA